MGSMAADETPEADDSGLLQDLEEAERGELERRRYARKGSDLIWIEPDGRVRRERVSNLYYIQTGRGVFRVSRINGRVVEV